MEKKTHITVNVNLKRPFFFFSFLFFLLQVTVLINETNFLLEAYIIQVESDL